MSEAPSAAAISSPLRVEIGGQHPQVRSDRRVDEKGAHPTHSEHHHRVTGTRLSLAEGVEGDRHGLHQSGPIIVETQIANVQADTRRHRNVLGQGAVPLQAHREVPLAEVGDHRPARPARSARHSRPAGHQRAVRERLHPWTAVHHPAAELVTGNHRAAVTGPVVALRHREHHRSVFPFGGVGAADPGGVDLYQQLSGPRLGYLDLLDPDVAPAVVDGGSHLAHATANEAGRRIAPASLEGWSKTVGSNGN